MGSFFGYFLFKEILYFHLTDKYYSYKELTFNQNLHIEYYLIFYCISDDHPKISAESNRLVALGGDLL